MTKIKNTKKGMAKKTLSVSLAVAMLATSNVPVWAAEFSDGSEAAFTSEAPVEVEAPVVVDDVVEAPVAETTTEKPLYIKEAEWGTTVTIPDDAVLKNSVGTTVTEFSYEWLINGMQPADENGNVLANASSTSDSGISGIIPTKNHVGSNLTLKITGTGTFDGFVYETQPVTIAARNISKAVASIEQNGAVYYDGTSKALTDITVNSADSALDGETFTANDFTFEYTGDTVNATETGKKVKVTATVKKNGYTGSKTFDMTISPRTADATKNSTESADLEDKTKNDIKVSLKKTEFAYTGANIVPTTNDITVTNLLTGEAVDSKVATISTSTVIKDVEDESAVTVSIDKANDTKLNRNYASGAFYGKTYKASETAKVVARDLSTCEIDDISIGSIKSSDVTLDEIKELLNIKAGTTILSENEEFMDCVDIDVNLDAIHKGGEGTYSVVVRPNASTKNIVGRKTINLRVVQNNIADATLTITGGQIKSGTQVGSLVYQDEYYQAGTAVVKTTDQLGSIRMTSTENQVVLKEGVDYKIAYNNNIDAGSATVYLKGIGSWGGEKVLGTFTIKPAEISSTSITVPETVAYDGSKTEAEEYLSKSDIKVQATIKTWVKNGSSWTQINKLINVPTELYDTTFAKEASATSIVDGTKLTTTVKAVSNIDTTTKAYTNYGISTINSASGVTAAKTTTVRSLSVAKADVTVVGAPFTYTGKEITPALVVKDGSRELVKDVDYEIVRTVNAKNAGTASIIIKGKGDYSSEITKTVEFAINKANLADLTVTPAENSSAFTYSGTKLTPGIDQYTFKLGNVTLPSTDTEMIKATYPANSKVNINAGKEAGSVTFSIKADAKNPNFTGTKEYKFDIEQDTLDDGGILTLWYEGKVVTTTYLADSKDAAADKTALFENDGTAHEFDKVTYTPATGKDYKEGVDYEIKYYNNTRGPVAAIYVNAIGNYKNNSANKFDDNATTYTDAKFFKITAQTIRKKDVTVSNAEYAGGVAVKPIVTIVNSGKTLVDDIDYKVVTVGDATNVTAADTVLKAKLYAKSGYAFDTATWDTVYSDADGSYVYITWKVVAKDLANTTVTAFKDESGKVNVTVMNGSVKVPETEYDVKENEDGTVTVTAKTASKNYVGTKNAKIGKDDTAIGTPMIERVDVVGNKATVVLSSDCDGAVGYDYVISTDRDCITNKDYDKIEKNKLATETDFTYVQQGTYYAYCHAWKRVDGKKVFSNWSNAYPFVVTAITPDQPVITSVKANGSTVTVTYTKAANATGYDVVLGSAVKKVGNETRPVNYGTLVKKNVKGNTVTVTFKGVKKGTYYAGLHAFNRTSEDGKKVFSPWSNYKKITVK